MPMESVSAVARPPVRLRADLPDAPFDAADAGATAARDPRWFDRVGRPLVVALAAAFVVLGGANFDLNADEARLGLATGDAFGPLGRVAGYWDPAVWPIPLALGQFAGWFEDEGPTQNAIRWPAAIAGCLIGYLLVRRVRLGLNPRAAVFVGVTWFGSLGLMDRSAATGLDLITALGTVAALDRLLARGSGWVVGLGASWAFLAGGWPPVAVIALATVVLGRRGATWSWRTTVPVALAVVGWSAWALGAMPTAAWASALGLPITERSAWTLTLTLVALGLPWTPFAALVGLRSIRAGWTDAERATVLGWLQVAGASAVVGSIVPGLATAATAPALAGLAVAVAAVWDRLCESGAGLLADRRPRWTWNALILGVAGAWLGVVLAWGLPLGFAVAYYRAALIATLALSVVGFGLAVAAVRGADARRGFAAIILVAVSLKVGHWGYYVPEMVYRTSAGPWGRAIGQWVPDGHVLHTLHDWPADLMYGTGRPVRRLAGPQLLEFQPGKGSKFVLLADSEYAEMQHWGDGWPKLLKVAQFENETGDGYRVLLRTDEPIILGHPHKKNSAFE